MKRLVFRLLSVITVIAVVLPISGLAASQGAPISAAPAAVGNSSDFFINEVMFAPVAGGYEWVELKNGGSIPVSIRGYGVTDEDDNWYRVPASLPPVPAGAFVVVVFDGQGSVVDDLSFGDNVAVLHSQSGLTGIFEDGADQVALYRANYSVYLPLVLSASGGTAAPSIGISTSDVVSFVAWGEDPGVDDDAAVIAGVWANGQYKDLKNIGEDSVPLGLPGNPLGLVPGGIVSTLSDWVLYQEFETTKGSENPVPGLPALDSAPPATMDSQTFAIGWPYIQAATAYHFQMDNDSGFGSPEYDLILYSPTFVPDSPVPDGKYYWRVAVMRDGQTSDWSSPAEANSMTLPDVSGLMGAEGLDQFPLPYLDWKFLGIQWQLQHKDTKMVCRAGDNEMAEAGNEKTKNAPWDDEHPESGDLKKHGSNYCERAAVSMVASY